MTMYRIVRLVGLGIVFATLSVGPFLRGVFSWTELVATLAALSLGLVVWVIGRRLDGLSTTVPTGAVRWVLLVLIGCNLTHLLWTVYPRAAGRATSPPLGQAELPRTAETKPHATTTPTAKTTPADKRAEPATEPAPAQPIQTPPPTATKPDAGKDGAQQPPKQDPASNPPKQTEPVPPTAEKPAQQPAPDTPAQPTPATPVPPPPDKPVQPEPPSADSRYQKAITLELQQDYRGALVEAKAAASLQPSVFVYHAKASSLGGRLMVDALYNSRSEEARALATDIVAMGATVAAQQLLGHMSSEFKLRLGQALYLKGNEAGATGYLADASKVGLLGSEADVWLFAIYDRRGDKAGMDALATKPWIRFRDQNPVYTMLKTWN